MRGDRPFSEFTYAFAATHELTRLSRWWSRHVPIIPSLTAEGRLGYDVRFDLPGSLLFIQFKLSKERDNLRLVGDELQPSAEASQLRCLAYGGIWQFWTTSHQHRLLSRLATHFETTYYFAPKFTTLAQLNHHFAKRSIAQSSFIVRADEFPGPRSDQQHRHRVIAPKADPSQNFIFSKVALAKNLDWRDEMVRIAKQWPERPPLAVQVTELWKALPGTITARARERRLNQLRRSALSGPEELLGRLDQTDPPPSETAGQPSPGQRSRFPPWQTPIKSYPVENEFGGRAELIAKTLMLADELAGSGVAMAVAQPKTRPPS
jgi:hypothetical protein